MLMTVREWNKRENTERIVAVWGTDSQYVEPMRQIVAEIIQNGYAVRGDSVYTDADAEEE